jgi:hypothetical protein
MNDIPILMKAPMVTASLADLKTQTRRIINPQLPALATLPAGSYFDAYNGGPNWNFWTQDHRMQNGIVGGNKNSCQWTCPYGKSGVRLWVRETWRVGSQDRNTIWYAADDGVKVLDKAADDLAGKFLGNKNRPSILMFRWASRLTLEIADIRVERVQDISEQDAAAEGLIFDSGKMGPWSFAGGSNWLSARRAYQELWEKINGRGSWEANPWVWAITFRRVK